jgi:hypothetical protein
MTQTTWGRTETHARVIEPDEEDRRMWPQMDYYFSSPELSDYLIKKKLNVVGLSWGNLSKDQGQFTSDWKDQTDVCMLTFTICHKKEISTLRWQHDNDGL